MSYRTLDPKGAHALLGEGTGWVYLDVRTVDEFLQGHPVDASNVPVALPDPRGRMAPNPEFVAVIERAFARDAKLLVGCGSGGRSAHACNLLAAAGFTSLVNVAGGFLGGRDESGRPVQGWHAAGLPCSTTPRPERTFESLRRATAP